MEMHPIIKSYVPLAQMLVETFGDDCEVVLHDLIQPEHSVVYVANSKVTQRRVGQSFDQLVKKVIYSKGLKNDFVSNYYFRAQNNRLIRSSTLLLRDNTKTLIGAICINLDTTRITNGLDYLKSFLPNSEALFVEDVSDAMLHDDFVSTDESLNVKQMIVSLIDNILDDCINPQDLSRDEKIEKIRFMDNKGIFLMKGSVELVAEKIGVNKVTIYSYLDTVRGKRL
jgi:predicted transcriptional regulator YheO